MEKCRIKIDTQKLSEERKLNVSKRIDFLITVLWFASNGNVRLVTTKRELFEAISTKNKITATFLSE